MCGIIGYIGPKQDVVPIIIQALRNMEYRGYDSAGFCSVGGYDVKVADYEDENVFSKSFLSGLTRTNLIKAKGKIKYLEAALGTHQIPSSLAIGHTRWATHGDPTPANAHPHYNGTGNIFLAHNGIIENFLKLKEKLLNAGYDFVSETDTEVIAQLIQYHYRQLGELTEQSYIDAFVTTLNELRGTYGIVAVHADYPELLLAAKHGSPVLIGLTDEGTYVASDALALISYTKDVIYLDDSEVAVLRRNSRKIINLQSQQLEKDIQQLEIDGTTVDMEGYDTFMLKEICQQPSSIYETCRGRFAEDESDVVLGGLKDKEIELALIRAERVVLVGCGTAFYAAKLGEKFIEELCDIPAKTEKATEFGYSDPVFDQKSVYIFVSQSGETRDTIMALEKVKAKKIPTIGIVNVVGSTIARQTDAGIYTKVGPEVAVASTKAFTGQVLSLLLLAIKMGRQRNMKEAEARQLIQEIKRLPDKIQSIVDRCSEIEAIVDAYLKREHEMLMAKLPKALSDKTKLKILKNLDVERSITYLGRKYNYPVALEGALKIKEIAYVATEGFPSGELKHGPIAMIDIEHFSVFVIPDDSTYAHNFSNLKEIQARSGPIFAIVSDGNREVAEIADFTFAVPVTLEPLTPILTTIPLQLFAYYMALKKGKDVDKPRNLAKSVTVG